MVVEEMNGEGDTMIARWILRDKRIGNFFSKMTIGKDLQHAGIAIFHVALPGCWKVWRCMTGVGFGSNQTYSRKHRNFWQRR
ncbi:MAG: hypothetical protein A2Z14_12695 [Chloroflexi bacterium RBG_16_48_8]|nr:MAG: hypothetical protein A2Z14_12695 [Chloroflexi bacterium RBG_16_48_8]